MPRFVHKVDAREFRLSGMVFMLNLPTLTFGISMFGNNNESELTEVQFDSLSDQLTFCVKTGIWEMCYEVGVPAEAVLASKHVLHNGGVYVQLKHALYIPCRSDTACTMQKTSLSLRKFGLIPCHIGLPFVSQRVFGRCATK